MKKYNVKNYIRYKEDVKRSIESVKIKSMTLGSKDIE